VYEGVGITERLGDRIPVDIPFRDETGNVVTMASMVPDGQPVVLNFVYHTCPMLCSILLDQMVKGLKDADRMPGEDFQIITVSMAAYETTELARKQKDRYVAMLSRPGAEDGWHFLTGDEDSIRRLADAVGFGFKWVEESGEFAHPAALIFLTSEGTVTRYLHGMEYRGTDLDMALIEAARGEVASVVDRIILYCYQFDPDSNSYVVHATNIMKLGGLLTLGLLGLVLFSLWRREVRPRHHVAAA
jgi:protein SCO1/2